MEDRKLPLFAAPACLNSSVPGNSFPGFPHTPGVGGPSGCGKTAPDDEGVEIWALDWSQCPAVESIPGKVSGAWVFCGIRLPVATIFENLTRTQDMEWDTLSNGELLTAAEQAGFEGSEG
jgi:hypothetical protein